MMLATTEYSQKMGNNNNDIQQVKSLISDQDYRQPETRILLKLIVSIASF